MSLDVSALRLRNERLTGAPLARPEDVVRWLGAVQAQDFAGAKWALAQLDAVICSGPRRGKQFTYALLDERCPKAATPVLSRDEALAELTSRYFRSHGPASLRDFAWWSGLTVADAKKGVALCEGRLGSRAVDGKQHWLDPSRVRASLAKPVVHLLPNYDEYLIAYKDHD